MLSHLHTCQQPAHCLTAVRVISAVLKFLPLSQSPQRHVQVVREVRAEEREDGEDPGTTL